jgi:hypothetical protein
MDGKIGSEIVECSSNLRGVPPVGLLLGDPIFLPFVHVDVPVAVNR